MPVDLFFNIPRSKCLSNILRTDFFVKIPIDQDFREKREKVDEIDGIAVCGPKDPPKNFRIVRTIVAIDWDICEVHRVCVESVLLNYLTGMIHPIIQNLREKPSLQERTNVFNV